MTTNNRIRPRDGFWLTLALLLHAVLLLIPAQQSAVQRANPDHVTVNLIRVERELPVRPDEDERQPQRRQLIEPPPPQGKKSRGQVLPEPIERRNDFMADQSASRILDSLSRLQGWRRIERPARQLGDKPVYRPPANGRPWGKQNEHSTDDSLRPGRTGAIDRWLAADGSHNVVVQTAGGLRICGRAEAWNPMNPLLEPVLMYHKCGASGKRRFDMPERFMRSQRASRGAIGIK